MAESVRLDRNLQDDKHNDVKIGVSIKVKALEPDMLAQTIQMRWAD